MIDSIPEWLTYPALTTTFIMLIGYLLRGPLTSYFAKSVEHKFNARLEETKASIRKNERELETINNFLAARHSDRLTAIDAKRLEAAEELLIATRNLANFTMFLELMKILKIEEISKGKVDPELQEFFEMLMKTLNFDENIAKLGKQDLTKSRLYLSDAALNNYDCYSGIVIHATMFAKSMSLGLSPSKLLNTDAMSKKIIELAPVTKSGFEKFGEGYAFYWAQYFYDQVFKTLRADVSGETDQARDEATAVQITASSIKAQSEARQLVAASGLPSDFIRDDVDKPV
ncbi:hypothetical protein [Cognatiyoonia koreensis]|nr:hypothetical protein [Cognatiyoonia koreensis]